jgi:1,4-dihydroxy-6-naphthoate synthase
MYVNDWTIDYGPKGREAVRTLLSRAAEAGLVPGPVDVQFVG